MRKEAEILSKFSPDFINKIHEHEIARKVYDMLRYGGDPYNVIEQIIDTSINSQASWVKYIEESQVPKSIIVEANSEDINNIINDAVDTIKVYVNEWMDSSSDEREKDIEDLKKEWRVKIAKRVLNDIS